MEKFDQKMSESAFGKILQIKINFPVPSIKHCQKKQVEISYAKTNGHF
jgi:hypothetical protein